MALFFHCDASFATTEDACASRMFTTFIGVPSLVDVYQKHLNGSTSSCAFPFIHMLVDGLGLIDILAGRDEIFAFLGDDFLAVSSSCFLRSFSELLEIFFTASQQIYVVSKQQVAERSLCDGC